VKGKYITKDVRADGFEIRFPKAFRCVFATLRETHGDNRMNFPQSRIDAEKTSILSYNLREHYGR